MVLMYKGRFVVLQVDAANLLGIVNRGSPKLIVNELAWELFWFCLRHRITTSVKWVPREENAFANEISKMLNPEDSMLSRRFFGLLDKRWGPNIVNLFASGANNHCAKFYALYWCMRASGINAFGQLWTGGELLDRLSLHFDWKSVENASGTEGVGYYANSLVGVCPVVRASVPGHQPLL